MRLGCWQQAAVPEWPLRPGYLRVLPWLCCCCTTYFSSPCLEQVLNELAPFGPGIPWSLHDEAVSKMYKIAFPRTRLCAQVIARNRLLLRAPRLDPKRFFLG